MIDWHCHLLPGLDDGPKTTEESVLMAGMLAEAGFSTVCCTPHFIRGGYDNSPERVRAATESLQKVLAAAGIHLTLVPGLEYFLDDCFLDELRDPLPLPGNRLLVEIPSRCEPGFVKDVLYQVVRKGFTPLVAHPERCDLFASQVPERHGLFGASLAKFLGKREPAAPQNGELLDYAISISCGFQGDFGSFVGLYGDRVRRSADCCRERGLYTHYGTDLHSVRQSHILQGNPVLDLLRKSSSGDVARV